MNYEYRIRGNKMASKRKILTAILIGITIFINPFIISQLSPVKADGAPPPSAVGSDLYPNENATKVRMESETVVITIPETSDYSFGHSIVTATFYMRNLGDETETMQARFPMNMSDYKPYFEAHWGQEYCGDSYMSSIENLVVTVNGKEAKTTISTETRENWTVRSETPVYTTYNCWAYFDVTFPPGEQVIIQVDYKVGGTTTKSNLIIYKYILQTGIGWYDTIGTADILVQLPYEANDRFVQFLGPENYVMDENTIRWHFEDFEPEENIYVSILDPVLYGKINLEKAIVKNNPEDSEAWGRLAIAYKKIMGDRAILEIMYFPDYLEASLSSFQKSLALNPKNAEIQWESTNMLCNLAFTHYEEYNYITVEDQHSYEILCADGLRKSLKLYYENENWMDTMNDHQWDYNDDLMNYMNQVLYWNDEEFINKYHIDDYYDYSDFSIRQPTQIQKDTSTVHPPTQTVTPMLKQTQVPEILTIEPSPQNPVGNTGNENQNEIKRVTFSILINGLIIGLIFLGISIVPNKK
jgi:hypothetical protein